MTVHELRPRPAAPPDTADLLGGVGALIERYVVLPCAEAKVAITLFVAHTWAFEAAHATPYVAVVSPEKRSGKTRLIEVLQLLVREPWFTSSATESALFRKIERSRPTLLLDEVDAIFGSNSERTEPLRAVLNSGNRRGASATRVVGQGTKMEVRDFSTYCPKVLAGIDTGRLPETVEDRAVVIHMQRRREGEPVERLRYRFAVEEVAPLRAGLEVWAAAAIDHLHNAVPELPSELDDRAADGWEALFAIADLAGGDWPTRARAAAVELSAGGDGDEAGRGVQLLRAIRVALADDEAVTTARLLASVNQDDELPFGAWRDGKGLDARTLARMLKPYGVKPRVLRIGDETPRGYRRQELRDVFERYLPAQQTQHDDPQPPKAPHRNGDVADDADVAPPARGGVDGLPYPLDLDPPRPRAAGRCECDRPLVNAEEETCAKCGRPAPTLVERAARDYGVEP